MTHILLTHRRNRNVLSQRTSTGRRCSKARPRACAAEGLRGRVGLPAWPHLWRVEADLVAQVRPRLGPGQFDQAFSAGSGLTQRDAEAIVQDRRGSGTQT
jgi:hypothetical protein